MDRVGNSLQDPVIIVFMLGVAVGVLHVNLEIPQGRRDSI
jgi:hypothetical protein